MFFSAGTFALFHIVRRFVSRPVFALLAFGSLALFQAFALRGEGAVLTYSFARFAVPFALMLWVDRFSGTGAVADSIYAYPLAGSLSP